MEGSEWASLNSEFLTIVMVAEIETNGSNAPTFWIYNGARVKHNGQTTFDLSSRYAFSY